MPEEIIAIIRELMKHLPDTDQQITEDWEHCWNELGDDAQEAVKIVRMLANQCILKLGENTPSVMPIRQKFNFNTDRMYLIYGLNIQEDMSS